MHRPERPTQVPRVLFVNRFYFPDHSATSQLLTDLTRALARERQVLVLTSRQRYQSADANLARHETIDAVEIVRTWGTAFGRDRLPGRFADYITFMLSAGWWMLRNLRATDTLVLMTDPPMLSIVGELAASARSARTINWIQDLFPDTAIALKMRAVRPLAPALSMLRDRLFQRARINVVIGDRMRDRLRARQPGASFQVIHNWAPGDEVVPVARADNPLRQEWGLGTSLVVGYSGNMGRAHDFSTVLATAERVRHLDVKFLFIGDGPQRRAIEAEANSTGIQNIIFKPYQPREHLSSSLSAPDIHLVSLNPELEGCIVPSKFYGIAAAGRPTLFVGACDGEIATLLRIHQCGFAVSEGDEAGMTDVITKLCHDRASLKQLGLAARHAYETEFSFAHALREWYTVLESAAGA